MRASVFFSVAAVFMVLAGCGNSDPGGTVHTGGVKSTGGQPQSAGGSSGKGGTTGSSSSSNSGGTSGSRSGSGGTTGSDGSSSTGGTSRSGGSTSSGGATDSTSSTGGTTSTDGTGSGGQQGTAGASAGSTASGGTAALGGTTASGDQTGTGGTSATGGSRGQDAGRDLRTGTDRADAGTDSGSICPLAGDCKEPNLSVTGGSGEHCCLTYENWVGAGSATMVLKPDGYSVSWTGSTQFVGREGVRPGSGDLVVDYSATFQPNGNSYLCVYGWTTDPLVEYYVVDGWGSWRPPGGSAIGTVTSDGGTYDIYKSTRTNEPSIKGTATFPQYWSVRQQKKTSGTITLANHIKAWAGKSMPMGTFYEVSMTVEGYQSSGTADVKFSIK